MRTLLYALSIGMMVSSLGLAVSVREVTQIVPIKAFDIPQRDSVVYLYLANPSPQEQTVSLTLEARGELYFSKTSNGGTIHGSNLLNCYQVLKPKKCDMIPADVAFSTQTLVSMPRGTSKQLGIRVQRDSGSAAYPNDQGVTVKITVQENSGWIIASGGFQQENKDGTSYIGGAFSINSGRPF